MSRRALYWYWLLLFVPTVLVGAAAFRLVRHEGERLAGKARAATEDRARAIADNIRLAVSAVEDELGENLRQIPPDALAENLARQEKDNPLVRNVFAWDARKGLLWPSEQSGWTQEERRFAERYDALFSGRIPWVLAASETNGAVRRAGGAWAAAVTRTPPEGQQAQVGQPDFVRQVEKLRASGRQQALAPDAAAPAWAGGWIPWFAENRLHLLGWVQRDSASPVYGLELELAALLSRLMAAFPSAPPDDATYALLDDAGGVVCQVGGLEITPGARPAAAVSLAPCLPHWSVAAFSDPGGFLRTERGFVLLTGLLLAIVIVAILAGGSLLTWQARRHMTDALRKTSFVSNISHELKTPLTSIRMYAELLNEGRITDADKTKKYLNVIAAESQRLARLVNNVLDFSRLEQGRKNYRPEPIEAGEFLRRFVDAHRVRFGEVGLAARADVPAEPVWVNFDRDALDQVLLNLADNVAKYAAGGGELVIALERKADHARLAVMDRGPGIERRHRRRIFERFYRVDDSLTACQPGSGLGLSIARRLLRDLGGDLVFESRAGGGSCFVARMPCSEVEAGQKEKIKDIGD